MKKYMLVELYAGNYNTQDGLVNGAEGIFKRYTICNNEYDMVWITTNASDHHLLTRNFLMYSIKTKMSKATTLKSYH